MYYHLNAGEKLHNKQVFCDHVFINFNGSYLIKESETSKLN